MPTNIQTGGLSSQTLEGTDGASNTNIIYGDAKNLKNKTLGGDDIITGGDDGAINYIYGDAYRMEGKAKGGADYLMGGANGATNYIFGDAYSMKGKVVGGNDLLVCVNGSENFIYGDAYIMRDGAKGGDDEFYMDDGAAIFLPILNASSFSGDSVSESQSAVSSIFGSSFIGDATTIQNSVGGKDNINLGNQIKVELSDIAATSNSFSSIASTESTVNLGILSNTLLGDADLMRNSKGGDDIINTANSISINTGLVSSSSNINSVASAISTIDILLNNNIFVGDGNIMKKSTGGVDIINFSNDSKIIIGDTRSFSGSAGSGGYSNTSKQIYFSILDNFIAGDAQFFLKSKGGNDIINIGNSIDFNVGRIVFFNSPISSSFSSVSVDFSLSGNTVLGDAKLMSHSKGGDDVINVCNNFISQHGPIFNNNNNAPTITPYSFVFTLTDNNLYGDAETMIRSKGGDDTLSIGVGIVGDSPFTLNVFDNTLYGDAKAMKKSSGGNDILTGADGKGSITYLYGDAQFTDGKSKAGDDKLISGQGNDQMWGDFGSVVSPVVASNDDDEDDDHESEHDDDDGDDDHESEHDDDVGDDDHCSSNVNKYAGKDTFVFGADNGKDTIFDFQRGLDKIELKGLANFYAFSDLIFAPSSTQSSDLVIDLGAGNNITLVGVSQLNETDFVFTL